MNAQYQNIESNTSKTKKGSLWVGFLISLSLFFFGCLVSALLYTFLEFGLSILIYITLLFVALLAINIIEIYINRKNLEKAWGLKAGLFFYILAIGFIIFILTGTMLS